MKTDDCVSEILSVIYEISRLFGIGTEEAECVARHAVVRCIPKGYTVFGEGDEADGIYIILKGFVKVFQNSESGVEKIFAILTPGDLIGEMSLFGAHRRSASACALEKLEVLQLSQHSFESMISTVPALSLKISEIVAERLRRTNAQVVFAEEGSRAKILNRLLELAQICGVPDEKGQMATIPFRLTHNDLAALSGMARETATKKLRELANEQIISFSKQKRLRLNVEAIKRELGYS